MRRDKGNVIMENNASKSDVMETIIGESTIFEGCITSSATLRIDGTLNGEIKSKGTVIIGPSGKIKGDIRVRQLYVAGYIEGNVTADETTEFASSGHLLGDIKTANLVVEQGAAIDGKCTMKTNEQKAPSAVPDEKGFTMKVDKNEAKK